MSETIGARTKITNWMDDLQVQHFWNPPPQKKWKHWYDLPIDHRSHLQIAALAPLAVIFASPEGIQLTCRGIFWHLT